MNISGIESNLYLSDNPIFVRLYNISQNAKYVEIRVRNTSTQETPKPLRYYRYANEDLNIDISSIVKSMMPKPDHIRPFLSAGSISNIYQNYFYGNSIVLEFMFVEVMQNGSENVLTRKKTFIRGGKRTYQSNQNLSNGDVLSPTETIPVWNGFPFEYYYLGTISTEVLSIIQDPRIIRSKIAPVNLVKRLKVKGCEPKYVKFLNSLGGYSYWLFENWETEESNDNLGSILGRTEVTDLGNEYESEIELISKVPQQFLPIIKDLIFSEEIYLYNPTEQNYTRVSSDGNNVKENPFDVNFKVKLKFKLYNRYNPSLIW
ncbi:MAG TPA: hypothetical protein VFM82_03540 [Flavobacteriaceae bacterium]|nr:hypothetical protein [Flavobacteriaceae bacterium]